MTQKKSKKILTLFLMMSFQILLTVHCPEINIAENKKQQPAVTAIKKIIKRHKTKKILLKKVLLIDKTEKLG